MEIKANRYLPGRMFTRSKIAGTTSVLVVAGLLIGAARASGDPARKIRFNDASFWEVNRSAGRLSHWNTTIDVTGSQIKVTRGSLVSVEQNAAGIVVVDRSAQTLSVLNDRDLVLIRPEVKVPADVEVRVGTTSVVIAAPKDGKLYRVSAEALEGLRSLDTAQVLWAPGKPIVAEVGIDGAAHAIDLSTGTLKSWKADGSAGKTVELGQLSKTSQLTVVGATPVAYDPARTEMIVAGSSIKRIKVSSSSLLLAMPTALNRLIGAEPDGSVVEISLDNGEAKPVIPSRLGGSPIRPLLDDRGCVFAASQDSGQLANACPELAPRINDKFVAHHQLSGRIILGRAQIDDLDSPNAASLRGDGSLARIDQAAAERQLDDKAGDEGKQTASAKDSTDSSAGENLAPDAVDDTMKVRPERTTLLPVLANDLDPNGDELSVVEVTGVPSTSGATAEPSSGGRGVVFRPAPGFRGTISFQVRVSDPDGLRDDSSVKVTVDDAGNAAPVANEDKADAAAGRMTMIDVLANDTDPDGDSIALTKVTMKSGTGQVALTQAGAVAFSPDAAGEATFSYVVQDERGLTGTGTVTVTVKDVQNLAPIVRDDVFEVQLGRTASLDLLANDLDPDGGHLQLITVPSSLAPIGSLQTDGNLVRFNPTQQGIQSFTYQVSDGTSSSQGKATITVSPSVANRPALAIPDRIAVVAGQEASIDVIANDTDADGDVLGVVSWTAPSGVSVRSIDGRHLFVKLDSGASPVVVIYNVSDGTIDVPGTLLVTPVMARGNLPPIAVGDHVGVRVGASRQVSVLANDADPQGFPLTVTNLSGAPAGVTITPDRKQINIDATTATASFSFSYEVTNAGGLKSTAPVEVELVTKADSNRPPTLRQDRVTVRSGETVRIPVLSNDDDPDGDVLRVVNGGLPSKGAVSVERDAIRYDANPGSVGTDRFFYTVDDGHGAGAAAEVTVGVLPPPKANRAPVAVNDGPKTVRAGDSVVVDVLANDSDPDNDPIRLLSATSDSGTIEVVGTNKVKFSAGSRQGEVKANYTIGDAAGATASAAVTFKVVAAKVVGQPPVARPDVATVSAAGKHFVVAVLDNDEDPDGDASKLIVVSVSDGTVSADKRTVDVVGAAAPRNIKYVVRDEQGNVATGTIAVSVGSELSLVARDDEDTVAAGQTVQIAVLENDSVDPQHKPLRITDVGKSDGGIAAIHGDEIDFTATASFSGKTTFGYTISDKAGNAKSATVRVTVAKGTTPNRPPVVRSAGPIRLVPGESKTIDLAPLARDPERKTLKFELGAVPTEIGAVLTSSSLVLTAPAGAAPWNGSIPFTATDPAGASGTNEVIVQIVSVPTTKPGATTTTGVPGAVPTSSIGGPAAPTIPNTAPPEKGTPTPPTTRVSTAPTTAVRPGTAPISPPGTGTQAPGRGTVLPPVSTSELTTVGSNVTTTDTVKVVEVTTTTSAPTSTPISATTTTVGITLVTSTQPPATTTTAEVTASTTTTTTTVKVTPNTTTTAPNTTTTTLAPTTTTTLPPTTTTTKASTTTTVTTTTSTTTTTTTTTIAPKVPGVPAAPAASAGGPTSANMSWGPPGDPGVPPVSYYNVYLNGGSPQNVGNVTSFGWGGLTASTTYSFSVAACNVTGCSAQSGATTVKTAAIDVTVYSVGGSGPSESGCSTSSSQAGGSTSWQGFIVPANVRVLTSIAVGVGGNDGFDLAVLRGGSAIYSTRVVGVSDAVGGPSGLNVPVNPGEVLQLQLSNAAGWTNGGSRAPSRNFFMILGGDAVPGVGYNSNHNCGVTDTNPKSPSYPNDLQGTIIGNTG